MLSAALLSAFAGSYAQRNDMYYRPSKDAKTEKTEANAVRPEVKTAAGAESAPALRQGAYESYTDDEIDAYNRRYDTYGDDTLYLGDGEEEAAQAEEGVEDSNGDDYECTVRLVRFHSPLIGVYCGFGDPFYWDYYYTWNWGGFYTPWVYDAYWGWSWSWWHPYYHGWNWYYRPWNHWAWNHPWHYPHGYHYGWHVTGRRHFADGYRNVRPGSAGGRIWSGGRHNRSSIAASRPSSGRSGYNYRSSRSGGSVSSRGGSVSGSRSGTSTRSFSGGTSARPAGGSAKSKSSVSQSTRSSGGGSSAGSSPGTSTRSFGGGASTRSFSGGGGGISTRYSGGGSVRSGGGTRSFGGGGGGGRRR